LIVHAPLVPAVSYSTVGIGRVNYAADIVIIIHVYHMHMHMHIAEQRHK